MKLNKRACRHAANVPLYISLNAGVLYTDRVKYLVTAAVKLLGGHRVLAVYFYECERLKANDRMPKWVVFQGKDDFATLERDAAGNIKWRNAMLVNLIDYYSGNFLPSCVFYKKEGCYSIAGFIDAKSDPAEVLWALNRYQQNIRDRQAKVRRRKRDAVVRNKMCSVPQTPANLKRWADKHIMTSFLLTIWLFDLPILTVITLIYLLVFWVLLYRLLLFWKAGKLEDNTSDEVSSFYEYTVAQIKHEEALRKEFTNYLHDDILQDLLSMKNLVHKANQIEIQQLLEDTLRKLTSSIRFQMQAYHPKLLKNLTFKENLQSVLDSITNDSDTLVVLDCRDDIFLVEPYTMLICRFARELTVNALKHSHAVRIDVKLQQEQDMITLQVSDNGTGFSKIPDENILHHGLASIQESVAFLNGKMTIRANPGGGTNINLLIPMKGEESYASFVGR